MLSELKGRIKGLNSALFSPDGKKIVTGSFDSTDRVTVWVSETGREMYSFALDGNTRIKDVSHIGNLLIATEKAEVRLFSLSTGKLLLSLYAVDSTDWVVLAPSGLFDASPGAMDRMQGGRDNQAIEFKVLKERYWQPGLWKNVMGNRAVEPSN